MRSLQFIFTAFLTFLFVINAVFWQKAIAFLLSTINKVDKFMRRIRFWLLGSVSFVIATATTVFVSGSFLNRLVLAASCTIFSFNSTFCTPNLEVEFDRAIAADTNTVEKTQTTFSNLQQQKPYMGIPFELIAESSSSGCAGYILAKVGECPPDSKDPRLEAVKGLTAKEIVDLVNRDYFGWLDTLPSCPCKREDIKSSEFVQEVWSRRYQKYTPATDYHPGAAYDYRQTEATLREYKSPTNRSAVPIKPGQQCTYDNAGILITNGPGAGTPDLFGTEGTNIGSYVHTSWDMDTFNALGFDEYIKTWQPNNGNKCSVNPQIKEGKSYGDPHIATFDGMRYSFQTVGEFILTKSIDGRFEVQTRQAPVKPSLSLNSAVAMKVGSSRVALYSKDFPDADTSTPLRINGKPTTIQGDKLALPNGGEILKQGNRYVVNFSTGEKVVVSPISSGGNSYFNVSPFVYNRSGKYSGLLGNVNGNPNDDQRIRGKENSLESKSTYGDVKQVLSLAGLRIPGALSGAEKLYFDQLYKEFGNSWRIKQEESLFDYPTGKTTKSYVDPAFPDKYLTLNMLSTDQVQKARNACTEAKVTEDLMEGCIFDVGFSGFSEFARATAEVNGYVSIVNQLFPRLNIPTTGQVVDQVIEKIKPRICVFGACL